MNIQNFFKTLSMKNGFYVIIRLEDKIVYSSDSMALSLEQLAKDSKHYVEFENRWYDYKSCKDETTGYTIDTFYDVSFHMNILKKIGTHIVVKNQQDEILFISSAIAKKLNDKDQIDGKAYYLEDMNAWFECHENMIELGKTCYKIEQYNEVTHYIEENQELKYDELTGLYNRHGILEQLQNMISELSVEEFIVIIGDIDYFKQINDTYGHDVGDLVLKQIGTLLKTSIENGFCGRYGGEEFLIVLDTEQIDVVYQLIENIRKKLETMPFHINENEIHVTMSFGISKYHKNDCILKENELCISNLVKTADIALMESKQTGRNKTLIYNENMKKGA